jgi:histone arginine demethylase JMJD6
MKMKHFLHYCRHDAINDDSPLYIFDSGFYKDRKKSKKSKAKKTKKKSRPSTSSSSSDDHGNDDTSRPKKQRLDLRSLLDDYQVPDYFVDDLFRLTGSQRRPPYRWLVIGSGRSGTG